MTWKKSELFCAKKTLEFEKSEIQLINEIKQSI